MIMMPYRLPSPIAAAHRACRLLAPHTLEDAKAAADVRGSRLYHCFLDKDDLVQAVLDYQADTAVNNQRQADSATSYVSPWRVSAPLRGRRVARS